jgi:hypothetical protein
MEKDPAIPNFYRKEFTRLVVDIHMDDFHGTGRRSEVTLFLSEIREEFKLKASDCIIVGAYTHLKRTRLKLETGVFVGPNQRYAVDVISALGLDKARAVATPSLDEQEQESSPLLHGKTITVFRSCVGSLIYLSSDRIDIQKDVGLLAGRLAKPTEFDYRRLVRLGRYLVGRKTYGVWMPKPVSVHLGTILLDGISDTDWAGDKTRRSVACGVITADGCRLAAYSRRQAIVP